MLRLSFIVLLGLLLIGCAAAPATPDRPTTVPQNTATSEVKPELEKYFDGMPGTFVLYDLQDDHYLRYNPDRATERFLPASTFKILNSLNEYAHV